MLAHGCCRLHSNQNTNCIHPACLIILHSNQNTNCRRVEQPKITPSPRLSLPPSPPVSPSQPAMLLPASQKRLRWRSPRLSLPPSPRVPPFQLVMLPPASPSPPSTASACAPSRWKSPTRKSPRLGGGPRGHSWGDRRRRRGRIRGGGARAPVTACGRLWGRLVLAEREALMVRGGRRVCEF